MSEFIVTARKWRPVKFEDVVGQDHVTGTLRNAIKSNRLAHAYLFSGPRGVGKTTTARLLAKAVNCLNPTDSNPDNNCELCNEITSGQSFNVLEIDGASNRGVDEIRSLRESVRYPPTKGIYKVYIIDEVHMLTKEAFNALLKTLEEPPRHVLFMFATTEIHKLPPTILSRCQRFDFRRLSVEEIVGNLRGIAHAEGVSFEEEALMLVARKADGSLRDGQSLFDQVISLCGREITYEDITRELRIVDQDTYFRVTDMIRNHDAKEALRIIEEVISRGYDLREFLEGVTEHIRNLLVVQMMGSSDMLEVIDNVRKRYETEAGHFSTADLLRLQRFLTGTHSSIRWSSQPRFRLEADFVQMARLSGAEDVGSLIQRIDELKKKAPELHAMNDRPAQRAVEPKVKTDPLPEPGPTSEAKNPVTEDQVRTRWPQIIKELKEKRISLGVALEGTLVSSVHGHLVKVGCDNEFTVSSVKRYRQDIQDVLQNNLGSRVQIEPVLVPPSLGDDSRDAGPKGASATPVEEHPVVKAMIRELGAEPL